ncbi:unnamed protein product [Cunninghamella blakesleeana]
MTKNLFINILFILFYYVLLNVSAQIIQPQGRLVPGCVLIQSKIYCYGGLTKYIVDDYGPNYLGPINDHITLDLNTLGNLSQFNQSKIQWNSVSNTYNGVALTNMGNSATVRLTDNTYLLYGGAASTYGFDPNLTYPFLHYNPQSDTWNSLPLQPNNTYSTRTQLVNLGDDTIWVWGGGLNSTGYNYTYDYGIFDYKTSSWPNMYINTGAIRMDHTVTLSSNGVIYIMGGYYKENSTAPFYLSEFSLIPTYDTKTLLWKNLIGTGQIPSNRGHHSTVPSPDGNSFYIYGGAQMITTGLQVSDDVFYIYDCYSNSFKSVDLSKNPLSHNDNNNRYGHFAALYNSTYLVLSFGFNDASTAAESLSILNVANPTKPVWATSISGTPYPYYDDGPDLKMLVPAIVVPVVVVLLAAGLGIFFYIRYRKRERENAFVLEQEDPRKRDSNPLDFNDEETEAATTEVNTNSVGGRSVDVTKPFMMENENHRPTNTLCSNDSHITDSTILHDQSNIRRKETADTEPIKPFEYGA